MLKFFFNRKAPMVYLTNTVAGLLAFILLGSRFFNTSAPESKYTLGFCNIFLIFSWLFFNAINLIPWYGLKIGKVGIRLHLQKNIVPLVYLLCTAFLLKLMHLSEWYLLPFVILTLPLYYVSIILLYFHFRDDSAMIPGYFSDNHYLNESFPLPDEDYAKRNVYE